MIDDAMEVIERDNPSLKGVLPTNYSRPSLDKQRLGELIDLIGRITIGTDEAKSRDVLGRVYEYFLGQNVAQRRDDRIDSSIFCTGLWHNIFNIGRS